MRFEESEYGDMTNLPWTFIYFLIDNGEVVYVGQTTRGMSRVYAHYSDKAFDSIYIIRCDAEDLDRLEAEYIVKYKPKYNKNLGKEYFVSLYRLAKELRLQLPPTYPQFTVRHLRKIILKLNIPTTTLIQTNGTKSEFIYYGFGYAIYKDIMEGRHREIFSIGI